MLPRREYYEGVLQIRNANKEILDFINNSMKKSQDVYISKVKKAGTGFDLYISNRRYILYIGRKLKEQFGGILKKSPRLFTKDRQTSKNVYRVNVLLELYDFRKGDVLEINNHYIKVSNIGKTVSGKNLETEKRVIFLLRNSEYKVLKKYKTTVCKLKPQIEVLHPETYQNIVVSNKADVKMGEKVNIVIGRKVLIV
jgi:nonsense-mediated mRNA decay protein 3